MDTKYRKKPLVVEAYQWDGNLNNLIKWAKARPLMGSYTFKCTKWLWGQPYLHIKTNKGSMKAKLGDWIIKGIKNEFYPVNPSIFKETYEKV